MKKETLCFVIFVFLICNSNQQNCISKLSSFVEKGLQDPKYADTTWAVNVYDPSSQKTIYSYNPTKFFTPASNTKLLTTSALFTLVPTDYTFKTPVFSRKTNTGNVVDLCIQGKGDPSISYNSLLQFSKFLSQNSTVNGIHNIYLDSSYFTFPIFPDSWEYQDLEAYYGAAPSSLVLNENSFGLTVTPGKSIGDPVQYSFNSEAEMNSIKINNIAKTVSNSQTNTFQIYYPLGSSTLMLSGNLPLNSPSFSEGLSVIDTTSFFLNMLNQSLYENNLKVDYLDNKDNDCSDSSWTSISTFESDQLLHLMNYTLKVSDNLYTELFCKLVGKLTSQNSSVQQTDYQNGLEGVHNLLQKNLNVNLLNINQADGCGLSRHNLINSQAFIEVLSGLMKWKGWETYKNYLPVAGISGSLRNRFVGTDAVGRVFAKTGSMSGVNTLSGYAVTKYLGELTFSILSNSSNQSYNTLASLIDSIVLYLINAQNC